MLSRLSELLLDRWAGTEGPDWFRCRITELLDLKETGLAVVLDPIVGLLLLSLGNAVPCKILTVEVALECLFRLSSFRLSHSYLDKELMIGTTEYLEGLGFAVYLDWREDSQLSRDDVTRETAEIVRARIGQSRSLFFATTTSAKESRWMPWELGYMDGKKGRSAILPVTRNDTFSDEYEGQEYLGIYPYVSGGTARGGGERLWVHENEETYIVFEEWLKGNQPRKRD